MRLLDTSTLQLHEFFDSGQIGGTPLYAILSHTWEDEECTFQEVQGGYGKKKKGYKKIIDSCRLARSEGYKWLWADTCCIDKTSSAELSEAVSDS